MKTRWVFDIKWEDDGCPTATLTDNKAMFDQVTKDGATARTRYFERATLLIKRAVQLLIFTCYLVSTDWMIADILTKATETTTFIRARDVMMNSHTNLRAELVKVAATSHGALARMVSRMRSRFDE